MKTEKCHIIKSYKQQPHPVPFYFGIWFFLYVFHITSSVLVLENNNIDRT